MVKTSTKINACYITNNHRQEYQTNLLLTATHSLRSSPSGSMTAERRLPEPSVAAACFIRSYWWVPSGMCFLGLKVLLARLPLWRREGCVLANKHYRYVINAYRTEYRAHLLSINNWNATDITDQSLPLLSWQNHYTFFSCCKIPLTSLHQLWLYWIKFFTFFLEMTQVGTFKAYSHIP